LLARAEANSAGLEDWQSANLREMRRERDQAIATPQNLVSRLAKATGACRGQVGRGEAEERLRESSRRTSRKS
jgi:Zn-dependent M32 family carboxypeptidase